MSNSPVGGSIASIGIARQAIGSGTVFMIEAISLLKKTIRQKRRGAETQRRKGLLPGATGRPPVPFGRAVRSALGSESELSSPFASLTAAGFARHGGPGRGVPCCRGKAQPLMRARVHAERAEAGGERVT